MMMICISTEARVLTQTERSCLHAEMSYVSASTPDRVAMCTVRGMGSCFTGTQPDAFRTACTGLKELP